MLKAYNAYVGDEWILLKYDLKTKKLTHEFDGRTSRGTHQLKVVVVDRKGNEATFEQAFTR